MRDVSNLHALSSSDLIASFEKVLDRHWECEKEIEALVHPLIEHLKRD